MEPEHLLEDDFVADLERQPLLPKIRKTPLPLLQVAIVCFARLAEPIAFTQIFPYVNQMLEELEISPGPESTGFYSGLVDSIFAVAQLFTIYLWGRLSDRIGRKPVVLTGLLGVALASFCFGLSRTLPQMLVSRALAGGLSGNAAIIATVLGELTDETNQAQAFALSGGVWALGSIVGPLIGGMLSHPAERYPGLFGSFHVLKHRPFFLPCLVSSLITLTSFSAAYFFLEETLPSKLAPGPTTTTDAPPPTLRTLLALPAMRKMLRGTFFLYAIANCYQAVFPMWAYTPIALGGLSRSPREIGIILGLTALIGVAQSFLLFPVLHDRFGTRKVYTGSTALYAVVFIIVPIVGIAVRAMREDEWKHWRAVLLWAGPLAVSATDRVAQLAFAANMIVVKTTAPTPQALGVTFGLVQTVACVARAGAPSFVGSLFATSVKLDLMRGNAVWLVMFALAVLSVWFTDCLWRA